MKLNPLLMSRVNMALDKDEPPSLDDCKELVNICEDYESHMTKFEERSTERKKRLNQVIIDNLKAIKNDIENLIDDKMFYGVQEVYEEE